MLTNTSILSSMFFANSLDLERCFCSLVTKAQELGMFCLFVVVFFVVAFFKFGISHWRIHSLTITVKF